MSGGVSLPRFSITVAQRASVSVAAQGRPVVASVTARGQQGVQGQQGIAGPQGAPGDYGYVRFDEVTAEPIALLPNIAQPFMLVAPLMIANSLRAPFNTFAFLSPDGQTFRARASGDSYLVRVRYSVVAQIAGGTMQTNLFVTGNTTGIQGASSTRQRTLGQPAGTSERVDELFQVFPGAGFVANGALFQLQCSVHCVVSTESLIVTPEVAAS